MSLNVIRAGFLTTVQDLGRVGYRSSGVSLGGALDAHALRVANVLVGNDESAAGLELTLGTMRFAFEDDRLIAWCGGPFQVSVRSRALPPGRPMLVRAGEEIITVAPPKGGRAWLGISGGIDLPLVLGSRSTDLRAGFGGYEGRALRDGDSLPLAPAEARVLPGGMVDWSAPNEWSEPRPAHSFLRVSRGADWLDAFTQSTFTVTPDSDRMGVRLQGPELHPAAGGDLVSEAVAPGTIQVPPSGDPILLLGDCQTIGGYPKVAHLITIDLSAAAQLQAGDAVRFIEVSLGEAQRLLRAREEELEWFRAGVKLRAAWS